MHAHMHVSEQETHQLHASGGRGEVRVGVGLAAAQPNRRRHGTGLGEDLQGAANKTEEERARASAVKPREPHPLNQSLPNSPILFPPKPILYLGIPCALVKLME